jgi:hypothetical protein
MNLSPGREFEPKKEQISCFAVGASGDLDVYLNIWIQKVVPDVKINLAEFCTA